MSPFSIVPPSNYRRRPRVRISVRADARPFVPSAKADAVLLVVCTLIAVGAFFAVVML